MLVGGDGWGVRVVMLVVVLVVIHVLVDVGLAASGFDALLLLLGQCGDVAIHGVLQRVSMCGQV